MFLTNLLFKHLEFIELLKHNKTKQTYLCRMIHFEKFTLENGLRVLVHEDKSTPMAVLNVLYDVGARD